MSHVGKTVLVTGASSGAGFVTARELARMGTQPVTHDREVAARLWRVSADLVGLSVAAEAAAPETPTDAWRAA